MRHWHCAPALGPLALLVALLQLQEYQECHALIPPSTSTSSNKALRSSILTSSFIDRANNNRRKIDLRSSSNEDDISELYGDELFDELASEAILNGQGNLFSVGNLRGGDDDDAANNTNILARSLSFFNMNKAIQSAKQGYDQRIAADPSFLSKSILEIILAASTQYMAEVSRRGQHRILPEIDFVFAGILTAVVGKYYSMWRVARTVDANVNDTNERGGTEDESDTTTNSNWRDNVPTNAFQPTLLDGQTKPTIISRFMAFLLPMPQLFRAGVIASTIGYGLTWSLIRMRTLYIPDYVAATQPVSVPLAAIYTGLFMAFVSNIRYQLLQGIVEPYLIDGFFFKIETFGSNRKILNKMFSKMRYLRHVKKLVIVLVRWANGLLGSWIAIGGMRACGLQKLKD